MVVNGVLIPEEMRELPMDHLKQYAAEVRKGNAAFLDAYWTLEEAARKHGLDFSELFESEGRLKPL